MTRAFLFIALGLIVSYLATAALIVAQAHAPLPEVGKDHSVLVLGKKTRSGLPDQDFSLRIHRLEALLLEFPGRVAIASGSAFPGQLSEAEFVSQALPGYPIILETQARSTRENLRYSIPLAPQGKPVAVITNRYHLARTGAIARQKGLSLLLVPAEQHWEWSWSNTVSLGREAALYWPARLG